MYSRALKIIREYHRISQKDAASSLGISKSYLSEIEGGKKSPSLDILERYSDYFKIPLSSILLFSEISNSPDSYEKFRGFAADKILKILEWIQSADDVDVGGAGFDQTEAHRLPPLRDRLPLGPSSPPRNQRRGS